MAQAQLKPTTKQQYFPFRGGLDLVTPALEVDPGFALDLQNFEPYYNGGYRRVDGYERFDGRPKPSAAALYGAAISSLSGIALGTAASLAGTGLVSGATARIVETAAVGGTNWLALTALTGTFQVGEKLVIGTSTSTGQLVTAPSGNYAPQGTGTSGYPYYNEFLARAQNYYRQNIGTALGTGNVLGAWQNGTNIYAVRSGTLSRSTGTGWTTAGISFVKTMYYSGLNTFGLPPAGVLISGANSGAIGTLYAAVSHNTTAGYLALTGITGTFQNNEPIAATISGSTNVFGTSASLATQFALPATGYYRWRNYNFFATSPTYYTYGVNGVGPAFQIDNNNVVCPILFPLNPLTNQPSANNPFLVEVYQGMLMLGLPGGVYQSSVPGQPLQYNGFLGANQFSVGAELTSMFSIAGPALCLTTARNVQVLYGTSSATFQQTLAAEHTGSVAFGSQSLDTLYSLGNLGVSALSRTQTYGNFAGATVSQLIQPLLATKKSLLTDSTIVRGSNQARFYFSDGSVLIMYVPGLGQQNKAWAAIQQGVTAQFGYAQYPITVFNICNSEDANGNEVSYFSSNNGDGYVYQDRSGTSWDGAAIASYTRLEFNQIGSPAVRKFFRRADIEIQTQSQISLKFAADLSYSNGESGSVVTPLAVYGGGGFWDTVNWNSFTWDGQTISSARAQLAGTGDNIGFLIAHQAITDAPFVLQGVVLHFDARRLQR